MVKKILSALFLLMFAFQLSAQSQGDIRFGLNLNTAFPSKGFGMGGDLDLRYNVLDNLNVGAKIGLFAMAKGLEVTNEENFSGAACAMFPIMLHGDYYFNSNGSAFAPFAGAGIGTFPLSNVAVTNNSDGQVGSVEVTSKFGGLARVGFEAARFRLALEYYLISKSDLYDTNANKVGEISNSFFNLSIGFYIGGSRWGK